jgi:hypothetical protein
MHEPHAISTKRTYKKTQNLNPLENVYMGRIQLKCDGTRWRTVGEVKGKLVNGVGSQYSSHHLGTWCISITTADAHTSAASSRLNWRPGRFKWTRPFRRKTKSGFCACAITFQTQSTNNLTWHIISQLAAAPVQGFPSEFTANSSFAYISRSIYLLPVLLSLHPVQVNNKLPEHGSRIG